jgi:glyoxylase-like metal-dependent hydrolase (beta-lactamase superfamily II)
MQLEVHRIVLGITSCYLIRHQAVALVDCGTAGQWDALDRAIRGLNLGITASDISLLVLTHGHFDHVGSASQIAERAHARVAIHQQDARWLAQGQQAPARPATRWARILSMGMTFSPISSMLRFPGQPADLVLADEDMPLHPYGIPGRVIHTPGHTSGSVSLVLDDGQAMVGDLVMNGFPSLSRRPDWPIIAEDMQQVRASWGRLLREGVHTACPGHGRPFPAAAIAP